jgi:conjugal transfer pilus assembly protein TraF
MWIILSPLYASSFLQEHNRGWHWYEVLPSPGDETTEKDKEPLSASDKLKRYREHLEETLAKAILSPTQENVRYYQEQQQELMAKSNAFAGSWLQNLLYFAKLDHTLSFPVNQNARHIYLDQGKENIQQTIRTMAQSYGLFFFFASNCRYCHKFALMLKEFSRTYQWDVLAISLDGGEIEGFKAVPDNGLAQQWQVSHVPSLYAVNPKEGVVLPLAHGLISLDQLEERVMALARGR